MSRRSKRTPGDLRRGYRHPIRRDRVLWFALAVTAVLVVIEFALARPSTPLGWFAFGLLAVCLAFLVITLTGIFAGTIRGFLDGWTSRDREVEEATTMTAPRSARPEPTTGQPGDADRASDGPDGSTGTVPPLPMPEVPESVKKLAAQAQAKAPKQADVDRAARALGRGFRAARKAYKNDT